MFEAGLDVSMTDQGILLANHISMLLDWQHIPFLVEMIYFCHS
jgi:hypothetical protein